MLSGYVWFVWALLVTVSNIVLSFVVFYVLQSHRKLNRHLKMLRDVSVYYALGMFVSILFAIILLVL